MQLTIPKMTLIIDAALYGCIANVICQAAGLVDQTLAGFLGLLVTAYWIVFILGGLFILPRATGPWPTDHQLEACWIKACMCLILVLFAMCIPTFATLIP